MKPNRLRKIIQSGETEKYSEGEFFHSLDFSSNKFLFVVKTGFVKRYSISEQNVKAIESIYGPNYFFPLSPVFAHLFEYDLNQTSYTYIYQAMTDVELHKISIKDLDKKLKEDPKLYADLLYETGRRLKVDIDRLTSNALKTDYKKTAHQLVCLAEEFGESERNNIKTSVKIIVPLKPVDIAEQVNITKASATEALAQLEGQNLIKQENGLVSVPDVALLRDAYLR
jgi:CRP-like cAMP-binding protein